MDNFDFSYKTDYLFGFSKEDRVDKLLIDLNVRSVLVVCGMSHVLKSGLLERVVQKITSHGIECSILDKVNASADNNLIYKGIEICKDKKVDFILAIGSGSVIDSAKAIAMGVFIEGDFFDIYFKNKAQDIKKALPLGVILTTIANGSESSYMSSIQKTIDTNTYKLEIASKHLMPLFSILNPELTFSLSPYKTASCGSTLLCKVIEQYFSNAPAISLTDRLLEGMMISIIETLPRILKEPYNYDLRANFMWASTIGCSNICSKGRKGDRSVSYLCNQIRSLYDIEYGALMAIIMPSWMEFTLHHNIMRYCQFANRVFGIEVDFEHKERTAHKGINALKTFFKDIGMPSYLKDININESSIPVFLRTLLYDKETIGNFVVLKRQDCEAIYKYSMHEKVKGETYI